MIGLLLGIRMVLARYRMLIRVIMRVRVWVISDLSEVEDEFLCDEVVDVVEVALPSCCDRHLEYGVTGARVKQTMRGERLRVPRPTPADCNSPEGTHHRGHS